MIYVMQASPVTRLCLPEWHTRCLDKPELLYSKDPFEVFIPRTCGGIRLTHMKITPPSDLIPKGPRLVEEDEIKPLVAWLTDENSMETDMYGVVAVEVGNDLADAVMSLIITGDDKKAKEAMADNRAQMQKAFKEALLKADERVMRACGRMYNIVRQTVDYMKKNNLGAYSPSLAEALSFEVMSKTVAERRAQESKAQAMMDKALNRQMVAGAQ
jgi:DNA-binding protein Fis